jgi:hypothetical protein
MIVDRENADSFGPRDIHAAAPQRGLAAYAASALGK